ncbi:dihydrolipoyl dehydrogenase, partial [Candidatus Woesearchaeota archaeon]|nr:dihydrolipoyl dehydrogenase [Candidatus Woesearchaeota archaeon]
AHLFGLKASLQGVDFAKVTQRASHLVDAEAENIENALQRGKNPTLFKGRAKFFRPYSIEVNGEKIFAKKILIAAGARPSIPSIPGLESVPYLTSTEALRLKVLPKSMTIIGGGYIAAELGHFYGSLGCRITILQRNTLLLPREDQEVAKKFTQLWEKKCDVVVNAEVKKVEKSKKGVTVIVTITGQEKKIVAEKLLIATGVKPNSDTLDLEKTGVKTNKNGFVQVNKFLETSAKNIWALGDIAGVYMFRHSANLEAEYAVQNILTKKKKIPVDYYPMPHAVFTHPQVAGVGLAEQECIEKKIKYVVGRYDYKDTAMGEAMAEKDGFVKFIVDKKTKEILGCHILGPDASVLLHEVCVAMKADRRQALEILQKTVHVHPALNEVVQRAARSI